VAFGKAARIALGLLDTAEMFDSLFCIQTVNLFG
jgi:hypothetical protein